MEPRSGTCLSRRNYHAYRGAAFIDSQEPNLQTPEEIAVLLGSVRPPLGHHDDHAIGERTILQGLEERPTPILELNFESPELPTCTREPRSDYMTGTRSLDEARTL
jgi:hypothetical protein